MLKKPNEYQLNSVANALRDELLRDWDTSHIIDGIQRVRANEIGEVTDVFVSPGLYARLCHANHGNRSRKPFWVNGFRVSMWRQGGLRDKGTTLAKS